MIVELIGSTSSGKSTMGASLIRKFKRYEIPHTLVDVGGFGKYDINQIFARTAYISNYNILNKKIKNQVSNGSITIQIQIFLRGNRLSTSLILPPNEVFCPDFGVRAHISNYTGVTSWILALFLKLKANCLNMISIMLVIIFGNRALFPLPYRWLIPKCYSIIY